MMMLSRIVACLLLVVWSKPNAVNGRKFLSPSRKYARKVGHQHSTHRKLAEERQNDKDKEKEEDKNNDKDNGKEAANNAPPPSTTPPAPTERPTTRQPTESPTPRPTLPPTEPPDTHQQQNPAQDLWTTPGQTFAITKDTSISMEELRDIQYFGGGEITLRFSLWFQDESAASQAGSGTRLLAILSTLQEMLCQSDIADLNNEEDPLGLNNLNWADAAQVEVEERELCIVPVELGGASSFRFYGGQVVEGSILLQPPTTYVVDRTASNTELQWTTWRVTWDVLRLGTFYILQGLENAGEDAADLETEEIYRAGVSALQGILELALEVSIREQSFDKLIMGSMVQVAQSEGMVLGSVYGEEVETLEPKLEWLGLTPQQSHAHEQDGEILDPTQVVANANGNEEPESATSTASDAAASADDDEWGSDDDRYDMEIGITETLDPEFWHPLRIVGILMFFFTTACLVGLSCMSRKRQKRREMERKEAKEGLLNNPQSLDDMLRASQRISNSRRTSDAVPTPPTESHSKAKAEDHQDLSIPLPNSLTTTS